MKILFKEKAIELRKRGFTYSEILQEVPVAKFTLSLWLHEVKLSKIQKQRITKKKIIAARRGGWVRRKQRLLRTKQIKERAQSEITRITKRELWLMGIMLYWAEGNKEKEDGPGSVVIFSNSDPRMIRIFIKWLDTCLKIPLEDIVFEIFIHQTHRNRIEEVKKYWANQTGVGWDKFDRIYFKKNKIKTKRKNVGKNYHGLVRVKIKRSTDLNRKIAGWIDSICIQCGVV